MIQCSKHESKISAFQTHKVSFPCHKIGNVRFEPSSYLVYFDFAPPLLTAFFRTEFSFLGFDIGKADPQVRQTSSDRTVPLTPLSPSFLQNDFMVLMDIPNSVATRL